MSLQGLQERLTALQETTTQLRELIDRLATLDFQPGSLPLDAEEESSASGELSAEIGQMLRSGLEEQELLCEEVKYARPDGHDKDRLKEGAERLGAQLASHRACFRRARLAAKKNLQKAQRRERELVVQSFSLPASGSTSPPPPAADDEAPAAPRRPPHARQGAQQPQQSSLSVEERQTVGASSNVTQALRRTHDLIAAELSRSEFAHQTLTESSAALKQLDESYTSLDAMLANSRDLLGTLLRSQKSDTWYLQTALYMLAATGAWLLFRRILYGPLWWLLWLPLRVLFGLGSRAGGAVIGAGGREPAPAQRQAVGEGGGSPVRGLPNDELPTLRVGRDAGKASRDDDDGGLESVMEKVREVVDVAGEADEADPPVEHPDAEEEDGSTQQGTTRGQSQGVAGEDARPRDEL